MAGFWENLDSKIELKARTMPYTASARHVGRAGSAVPKDFGNGAVAIGEGYEACTWVYRCVLRKQNMVASVPWLVRTTDPDGAITEDRSHPAAVKVNNPSALFDRWYTMHRAAGFLSVVGNVFLGKAGPGADDEDPGLWLESPGTDMRVESPVGVTPIEDGLGWIREYRVDGKDPWDPATMIHVMLPSLRTPFWGMSELQALAATVDTSVAAERWNLDSFGSGGMPSFLLVDHTLTAQTVATAREQLEERFLERGRQRTPWLLPGSNLATDGQEFRSAIELHKLGMSAQEIDWLGGSNFTRDEIFVGLGFHPADASNERATHDNARSAKRQAWEEAAGPLLDAFSSWFTLRLLIRDEREAGMVVAPDLSGVRALQDGRDSRAKTFRDLTEGGMIVLDAAKITNFEITDDVPEYAVPFKAKPVEVEEKGGGLAVTADANDRGEVAAIRATGG